MTQTARDGLAPQSFFPLVDWSTVVAEGADALKFLQGFCTNDVSRLTEGAACEAFFTNVKARVLAFGWVARFADYCVVLIGSPDAAALAEHLDRYVLHDDVRLSTPALGAVLVGDGVGLAAPQGTVVAPTAAFGASAAVLLGDAEVILAALRSDGRREIYSREFDEIRIRRGIPLSGVDVDDRNLPQEVDRNDRAISFTKGCYLGQEPVARIDAMGRVNWLLRGLRFEAIESVPRDAELTVNGEPAGRVTSFVSTNDGAIGLGYVRHEHAAPGAKLRLRDADVAVTELPMA